MFAILGRAQLLTPVWVEAGEDGQALARVVANTAQNCPLIKIDGSEHRMTLRPHMPEGLRPACWLR